MSDEPKLVEPMTDAQIASIVEMVETAERLATALNMSVSRATEIMLKTVRVMATSTKKGSSSGTLLATLAALRTSGVQ